MGKVFWHVTMSLDGFIAGPNDAMDWVFGYVPLDSPAIRGMLEEVIRSTGSVLSGRRSYNVGRKPGQRPEARKVLAGAWSGPVFVLTHKAPEDEADPSIKFLSGGSAFRRASSTRFGFTLRPYCSAMASGFSTGRARRTRFAWRRLTSRGQDNSLTFISVSSNRFSASTD
jgi:hypothetical protein